LTSQFADQESTGVRLEEAFRIVKPWVPSLPRGQLDRKCKLIPAHKPDVEIAERSHRPGSFAVRGSRVPILGSFIRLGKLSFRDHLAKWSYLLENTTIFLASSGYLELGMFDDSAPSWS
jgi:hypothetical protein